MRRIRWDQRCATTTAIPPAHTSPGRKASAIRLSTARPTSIDRILTIYRHEGGRFDLPQSHALEGVTPVGILPGVAIEWDDLVARLPPTVY